MEYKIFLENLSDYESLTHLPSLPSWPFPSVMQEGTWGRADYNTPLPPSKAAFPFAGLYPNSTVTCPAVY